MNDFNGPLDEFDLRNLGEVGKHGLNGRPRHHKKRYEAPPGVPDISNLDVTLFSWGSERYAQPTLDFLRANPHVWELMVDMTKTCLVKQQRFGVKMLVEVARWNHIKHTTGAEFKLTNSYTAYIGYLLAEFFPEMRQYVEMRPKAATTLLKDAEPDDEE